MNQGTEAGFGGWLTLHGPSTCNLGPRAESMDYLTSVCPLPVPGCIVESCMPSISGIPQGGKD